MLTLLLDEGRRTELAAAAFANRIWRDVLQRWDDEIKPAAIARHRELAAIDLTALDEEDLVQSSLANEFGGQSAHVVGGCYDKDLRSFLRHPG